MNPAYEYWLHHQILKPCRILIPGCGDSIEVVEFARTGFDVTALDISQTAIDLQHKHLDESIQSARLVVDDILTWIPDHPFDMVYEQTCLCALRPEDRHHYHHQLRHWLKPEGKLLALFMQTGRPGGPPYNCPIQDMEDLFTPKHWHWPEPPHFHSPHFKGFHEFAVILNQA